MSSELTADDTFMSLNGFDEIAIEKAFGQDVYTLKEKPFSFLRSLAFVTFRREGKNDHEAKQAAMELSVSDLNDFFPNAVDLDPNEPETEPGKEPSPSE